MGKIQDGHKAREDEAEKLRIATTTLQEREAQFRELAEALDSMRSELAKVTDGNQELFSADRELEESYFSLSTDGDVTQEALRAATGSLRARDARMLQLQEQLQSMGREIGRLTEANQQLSVASRELEGTRAGDFLPDSGAQESLLAAQSQLREKDDQLQELRQSHESMRDEMQKMRDDHDGFSADKLALIGTHSALQSQHGEAQERWQAQEDHLQGQLQNLQKNLESVREEMAQLTQTNRDLSATNEALASRHSILEAQHNETRQQWQDSSRELVDLQSTHAALSSKHADAHDKWQESSRELETLRSGHESRQDELDELRQLREDLESMQKKLEELTQINEGLTEANQSLTTSQSTLETKHDDAQQQWQDSSRELDELRRTYAALEARHDEAQRQWQESSRELETMRTNHESLSNDREELDQLREDLESMQTKFGDLKHANAGLTAANLALTASRAALETQHQDAQTQREESTRELELLRSKHEDLSSGMEDLVRNEIGLALASKNNEISELHDRLEQSQHKVRELQEKSSTYGTDDIITAKDEDYFEGQCRQLCQHVQQWVLRFSKFSDTKVCRSTNDVRDDALVDRFDNAILDGSDVDVLLADRVRRRDVFMSVVMNMVNEFIFSRYLFGLDRDQRQKIKNLAKSLEEAASPSAIQHWRAITLSLLSKRPSFKAQRDRDTEAVAQEIFSTLARFLPPPSALEAQILNSLRNVLNLAADLAVEMRTQRAEYMMLPPLTPEYDLTGDLKEKVFFNAGLMNERSGETQSNAALEQSRAVVRIVLFPLVVKRGDERGVGGAEDELVVCPAQVLVAREEKDRRGKGKERAVSGEIPGDREGMAEIGARRAAMKSASSVAPSMLEAGAG